MLRQPLVMELRKLLLESLHPALEMYLEPFAGMDREEPHPLGHIAPFVDATNDIGKGLVISCFILTIL